MARGIERQRIFQDDADREDFVQRVAGLVDAAALTVYAWAVVAESLPSVSPDGPPAPGPEYVFAPHRLRRSV
jgi:hypothetical protein